MVSYSVKKKVRKRSVKFRRSGTLRLPCTFRSILFFKSGFLSQNIGRSVIFNLTRQIGILFGFLVSILFAFINASIFVKRAKIPSMQIVSKEVMLDSICVTVLENVLFRIYCTFTP